MIAKTKSGTVSALIISVERILHVICRLDKFPVTKTIPFVTRNPAPIAHALKMMFMMIMAMVPPITLGMTR